MINPAAGAAPAVKVCCIASIAEAEMAIALGASALGLVSAMPSGPGVIDERQIARIVAALPAHIDTFMLTSSQDPEEMIEQQGRCKVNTLQLVDRQQPSSYARLRQALPGIKLVQVIHVVNPESLIEAAEVAPYCDALLLDSGNPALKVKELGGTGRTHDWSLSAQIVSEIDKPVFLAGGLRPSNVAAAIARVRPYGVDLCSGVRSQGQLDRDKLGRFMTAVGVGTSPNGAAVSG